jgi:tetratricopeptide (TPR) repeat protein
VENNRRTAAALGAGGELGETAYRQALAHLRRVQPAYDAYDEGQKALQAGETEKALQLARKAIGIEPKEASFYALRGDAQYESGRYQEALKDYDRALGLDDRFFRFYLQRGLTKQQLGDRRGARADLERSASLLPTAGALNGLGQLALADGDQGAAMGYLRQAAESDSAEGREAAATLAKIEAPAAGGSLETRLGLDRNGYVLVRLVNRGPRPVRAVRLSISYSDSSGRQRQQRGGYADTIFAGQGVLVPTRLGPLRDRRDLRRFEVRVLDAQGL